MERSFTCTSMNIVVESHTVENTFAGVLTVDLSVQLIDKIEKCPLKLGRLCFGLDLASAVSCTGMKT